MTEELGKHPILVYLTLVLPIVLLAIGAAVGASVFLLILVVAWLGISFIILFLPIESDNGSSS